MNPVSHLLRHGRSQEAVSFATTEVNANPRSPRAFAVLAHALMSRREYDAAERAVSWAIGLSPREPGLHFLRTRVNFARGHFEAALSDAQLATQESDDSNDHFYTKSCLLLGAACLVRLGHRDQAREVLKRVDEDVKVMAGTLLTHSSVAEQAGLSIGRLSGGLEM